MVLLIKYERCMFQSQVATLLCLLWLLGKRLYSWQKDSAPFPHRHAPWPSATAQVSYVAHWEN